MKSWVGNKLVSTAHVGTIDVRSDLQYLKFANITQGDYESGKLSFRYKAASGNVNMNAQTCEATGPVEVTNKNFDLVSRNFNYSLLNKNLVVPGYAEGKLYGGYLKANRIIYSLKSGKMQTGPLSWDGNIQKFSGLSALISQKGNADVQEHAWHFNAPGGMTSYDVGKDHVMKLLNCTATDGRIIVSAPTVVFNQTTDVVHCFGSIHYYSPKVNLTCDTATIFRKKKEAILTGKVVFYIKPKDEETVDPTMVMPRFEPLKPGDVSAKIPPSPMISSATPPSASGKTQVTKSGINSKPKGSPTANHTKASGTETPQEKRKLDDELRSKTSIRRYPVVVFAQNIDYIYQKGKRHALITGSPQAQQELQGNRWRRIWGVTGYYDGEANTLKLMGSKTQPVIYVDSLGDAGNTNWLTLSTLEGNDTMEAAGMTGQLESENPDLNQATSNAEKKDSSTKKKKSSPLKH